MRHDLIQRKKYYKKIFKSSRIGNFIKRQWLRIMWMRTRILELCLLVWRSYQVVSEKKRWTYCLLRHKQTDGSIGFAYTLLLDILPWHKMFSDKNWIDIVLSDNFAEKSWWIYVFQTGIWWTYCLANCLSDKHLIDILSYRQLW